MTRIQMFILEHGSGCTPLSPCDTCKVFNHLRHALCPDDYREFEKLLKVAIQEIPESINRVGRETPIAFLDHLTVQAREKLQRIDVQTLEDLLRLTQRDLRARGIKNYTIKRIVSSIAQHHGTILAE